MVAVAYRRWSFTKGSNCKALTGKILVFWIGGRLWEVVAHGGSSVYDIGLFHAYNSKQKLRAISSLENGKRRRVT